MAPTDDSVAQLIEVAPRLAQQLEELVDGLRGQRIASALSAEDVTTMNRALAARLDADGIPHQIATAPTSRRALDATRKQRAGELLELQEHIAQDWRAFSTAFDEQRRAVAGLLHRPFFECPGRARAASACEALSVAAKCIIAIIEARPLKLDDLDAGDRDGDTWQALRLGVEVEVAELQRRQGEAKEDQQRDSTLRPKAWTFLQVVTRARGERLTVQDIVNRAFKRVENTDDERALAELVTSDRVQVEGGGQGRTRRYWIESSN